jgi:hypothetical protein
MESLDPAEELLPSLLLHCTLVKRIEDDPELACLLYHLLKGLA